MTKDVSALNRPVVCVLAMHRSGSSAVGRLLNLLGVDLGPRERLLDPAPDNPTGFWEHQDFIAINDEILQRAGGTWDEPPRLERGWATTAHLQDLRDRARDIIARDFSASAVWGWKDPRTALTLPFWQQLLPDLRSVICLRNPLDVARSLERRDGFPIPKGSRLWLAYVSASLSHTHGRPRLITWYEDLVRAAEPEIVRYAGFLGRPIEPETMSEAAAFVTGDLRHHGATADEVLAMPAVHGAARALFFVLRQADGAAGYQAIDRLAEHITAESLDEPQAHEVLRDLRQCIGDQQAVIERLEDALVQKERHTDQVIDQLRAQDEQLRGLHQAHEETVAALGAAKADLARWRALAKQREADAAALRAQVTEILSSNAWKVASGLGRMKQRLLPGSRGRSAARRGSPRPPEITFLVPDAAGHPDLLQTVESLLAQTDDRWEALLAQRDDQGPADAPSDSRLRWYADADGQPAEALNRGLAAARGTFVAVLRAGDQLDPQATAAMLEATLAGPADVLYSDEDTRDDAGLAGDRFCKPDWSPELLLAFPYTGRLCLLRRELVQALGGWDPRTAAAEDYALVLAASRRQAAIRRLPRVLYHRGGAHIAEALTTAAAVSARTAALQDHLEAAQLDAVLEPLSTPPALRVRPVLRSAPLVSIVIATRDRLGLLRACIESIERRTAYEPYEIVVVDNDSAEPETLEYLSRTAHRVVRYAGPFNFSAINNAGARAARGEYLVFLNNDTEVESPEWLTAMLEWAQLPEIGCVGARLLFPDGRVQHVGVTLHDGSAFHPAYRLLPGGRSWLESELVRNYSAVTAACLMVRRSLFLDAGGFDETFPVAYNDVELCVRLMRRGLRNLYTPYAVLTHFESASREPGVALEENEHLRAVVGDLLWADPYCPADQVADPVTESAGQSRRRRQLARLKRLSRRSAQVVEAAVWQHRSLKGHEVREADSGSPGDVRWLDRIEIDGQVRIGLFTHPPGRAVFRFEVPRRGRAAFWLALLPEVWDKNIGGVLFQAAVTAAGRPVRSRRWLVNPRARASHRRWRRVTLPLSGLAGREVELTLSTETPPGAPPAHGWAVWGDPLIEERKPVRRLLRRQAEMVSAIGLRATLRRYARLLRGSTADPAVYQAWFESQRREALDPLTLRADLARLHYRPCISVITPVYNTDPRWLRACVGSMQAQVYENWEHCLADDGSSSVETLRTLEELAAADPRVKVTRLTRNSGISAASNAALALAGGEFVGLLDHDDELAPEALYEVVRLLNRSPDADFIYTDEDKLEFDGTHVEPYFKPDWSPEYLRSTMYVGHFCVYRRTLLERLSGFRSAFDGAQDYDLALRASEHTTRIHHIARVLYHWRKIPGSAAGDQDAKPWGLGAARGALADHVARLAFPATVEDQPGNGFWRVRYSIVGDPLVSIVVPTDGRIARTAQGPRDLLLHCLQSIVERTTYQNYELLVVDNGRISQDVAAFLGRVPHRRVVYEGAGPFNFAAKVNFAAGHARGEHLLLLNDDTQVITGEWLTAMLEFSQQPEIGAVGGKLFFPDGRIQHVGVVLGIGGGACHVLSGQDGRTPGYFGSALVIRNYSAVTGACCMTRRSVFEEVGGFDERFALDFNDVDYCLRVGARGYRVVGTPFAQLYHFEGATFGSRERIVNPAEVSALSERWHAVIEADPFYNPNLTRSALDYSLRL